MNRIVIKNGLYGVLIIVGVHLTFWIISDGKPNFNLGEVIGYGSMIISMMFVFLGVREYRNVELNGDISFGKALWIGLLIALIPSFAFGVYDLIYVKYLNPDFNEAYFEHYLNEMQATMSEVEFAKAKLDLEAQKVFWANPFMQFTVMFLTVFLIGFIIALISSMILKTKST